MAAVDQYIERIPNPELREQIREQVNRLTKKKHFGLVYESHLPDNVLLPEVKIRRGTKVALRGKTPNEVYEVQDIESNNAICRNLASLKDKTFPLDDLVAVAQLGDVIYPYLKPMDSVENAPDSDLWHTLIEADNYHALQTLVYLYPGMVDCIYIDPPYNKPNSHDWKYNCDYVDGTDAYRHSKWLSMMEARLKIAKKLLNPNDSVLIVTIDELEYHHLGCLLEQMFPEARIQMVSTVINTAGVSRGEFSRSNEFIYFVLNGLSSPTALPLSNGWRGNAKSEKVDKLVWNQLMRAGTNARRADRPNLFYPLHISKNGKRIVKIGKSISLDTDRKSIIAADNTGSPLTKSASTRSMFAGFATRIASPGLYAFHTSGAMKQRDFIPTLLSSGMMGTMALTFPCLSHTGMTRPTIWQKQKPLPSMRRIARASAGFRC